MTELNIITLDEVLRTVESSKLGEGWIVGGIVERGWSNRDADLIVSSPDGTEGLPDYFDIIVQEAKPNGPNIPVASLKKVRGFPLEFMKPKKTKSESNEYYDLDDFKGFREGHYFVEPKYDGFRVQLRKAGSLIQVLTDTGRDLAGKLPNIAEEARTKIPYTACILDCELVVYRGKTRLDHSAVTAYINSKSPPEDYHLKLKSFDILLAEDADLRNKTVADRKKALGKVPETDHIHPVEYKLVKAQDLVYTIKEVATTEGAMVKEADSKYNKNGEGWYKWKHQIELDVEVVEVHKKENGFVYVCKVGDVVIGETYATKDVVAKKGDIIRVSVDHITKKQDGTWGWYAPKVLDLREDKKEPDPESVLIKLLALSEGKGKNKNESEKAGTTTASLPTSETQPPESSTTLPPEPPAAEEANANKDKAKDEDKGKSELPLSEGRFVLHEHWWGKKHHFDLRFEKKNTEGKPIMIGWTLLADGQDEFFDKVYKYQKILSLRKQYHDAKWLDFEGKIEPGNPGNPTSNLTAYMEIRDKGHYKFLRRDKDFVDVELKGTKSDALKGRFYIRKVRLEKNGKLEKAEKETEDTEETWMFWKAKTEETKVEQSISFGVPIRVLESQLPSDDFIDIETNVLSTEVSANNKQYALEDIQANSERLNAEGGLLFAMGKHPDMGQEPDASDNVGVGQTYVEDKLLKAKARIYNTANYPDMVKRIRLGLVRDVSIEGIADSFKKLCDSNGCWLKAVNLRILRAVFVSAGADRHAKIIKILESIEEKVNNTNMTEENPSSAAPSAAEKPTEQPPAQAPAAQAPEPKPESFETKVTSALEKMLAAISDLTKAVATLETRLTEKPAAAPTPAPAEGAKVTVTGSQGNPGTETQGKDKPPRVKESQASPDPQSGFTDEVRKHVR